MKRLPLFATLALAAAASAADDPARDVVAFNASVRVDVDAAGKPVKVEAPADLPEAIRGFIEKRVASWQYQPARANGQPVPAVTFVRVGACAIPVEAGGGYRLGLDFKGNGPRLIAANDRIPPPPYPMEARRAGVSGTYRVGYAIQPDGSTRVTEVERLNGNAIRYNKAFRSALAQWIEGLRYEPEQVNGQAVATSMRFPVEYILRSSGPSHSIEEWRKSYLEDLKTRAVGSNECKEAAGLATGLMPVADSPVKVIPQPAT